LIKNGFVFEEKNNLGKVRHFFFLVSGLGHTNNLLIMALLAA
jgi:hypothetical protein